MLTAQPYGHDLGIVHQIPLLGQCGSLADGMEQWYFGAKHARWYMVLDAVGQCCVNGMSIMFRRSALAAHGQCPSVICTD